MLIRNSEHRILLDFCNPRTLSSTKSLVLNISYSKEKFIFMKSFQGILISFHRNKCFDVFF